MTERDSVHFGDTTIEYQVRCSLRRRRTVQISLDGGRVSVAAPAAVPDSELRAMVRRRAAWILSNIHDQESRATARPLFISGEKLPYLGRNARITVMSEDARAGDPLRPLEIHSVRAEGAVRR